MVLKNNFPILMALLLLTALASCGKFCQCEPDTGGYIDFKRVNQQGRSLVSGSSRLYTGDSIKFLRSPNDTATRDGRIHQSSSDSSLLFLYFNLPATKGYLYYNRQTPVDSIEVVWVEKKGKCCGEPFTSFNATQVKFNGTVIQPQQGVYVFIK